MEHYKAPQGQHRESLGLLCCAGVECRGKICILGSGNCRISILASSSFLDKTGLASMSCTVLAVAVMPTYEQNDEMSTKPID